jgi:HK97 family phage portal protein
LSLFDIFKKKPPKNTKYANMLNGYTPIFSQFGDNIYASDVVQQAIYCIVTEIKKLSPQYVKLNGSDVTSMNSGLQAVLENPNPLMTKSDFLEKIMWQLYFNYNSFIMPTYYTWTDSNGTEKRSYTGLYPIQPTFVEFIQDVSETLYIRLKFANNYETTIPYSEIIHIRSHFSVNEFLGGNKQGQPDNLALLKTLQLNSDLLNGVAYAMKSSYAINGVVRYNSLMDGGKMEANLRELERKLSNSENGFLPLDLSADFTPLERKIELVDPDTLEFIDSKILRHFGVPLCILVGDYTKEQYEAFYQKTLEPIIISLSEAFTKTLLTTREYQFGHRIKFFPRDLVFMTVSEKLEMIRLLGDSGTLFENEKRVALGLKPLSELEGIRMQSLNYVNTEIANKVQLGGENNQNEE